MSERQLQLLEALRVRERRGERFCLEDLVEETGYKLSTLRTYTTKRLRGALIFEDDAGLYEVRGALAATDEAFLRRLDQKRSTDLPPEDRVVEALSRRSREHLRLALSLFHQPGATCRVSAFSHHATAAWELLLTAGLLGEGVEVLEALNRGLLGEGFLFALSRTHEDPDHPVRRNLRFVADIAAVRPHLPLDVLAAPLSRVFQSCVLNFGARHRIIRGRSIPFGAQSGTLIEGGDPSLVEVEEVYGPAALEVLRGLLDRLHAEEAELSSPRFAIPQGYCWQLAPIGDEATSKAVHIDAEEDSAQTSLFVEPEEEVTGYEVETAPSLLDPAPASISVPELASLSALMSAIFESLEGLDRRLLEQRVDEGAQLSALEAEHEMDAEAIRERLGDLLARLRGVWGEQARRLAAPIAASVEESGGLLHRDDLPAEAEGVGLRRLGLALAVAEISGLWRWREVFLSAVPPAELTRRIQQLGDELRGQRRARLSATRAMALTGDVTGLDLSRGAFDRLLGEAFGMEVGEDGRIAVRRTRSDRLRGLMEARGEPMHVQEILDAYIEAWPDEDDEEGEDRVLEVSLKAILQADEELYAVGRESWVHRAALPIAAARLSEIVAWCVEFMEGMTGAISPQRLIGELDRVGKDRRGLTAALLRDALARHSGVVTFKSAHLIAHVESFREGDLTLDEWLEQILEDNAEPLTLPQVIDLLPPGVHFHRTAVHAALLTSAWAISLGRGRFDHIDSIGLDEARRRRLVDSAVASLPEDGRPVPCRVLLDEISPLEPNLGGGHRTRALAVIWGLLHKDERAQCGPGGMVARSRDEGARRLLETAIVEVLEDLEVAHIRQLRLELTARYGHGGMESAFRRILQDLVREGTATRLPDRLYTLTA